MSSPLTVPEAVAGVALPLGAGAVVDLPPGAPEWVRWAVVVVGSVIAPVLMRASPQIVATVKDLARRLLAGRRAKKLALAAAKRARAASDAEQAQRLLADGNDGNDVAARLLLESAHRRLDDADGLDADAAELDALGALAHAPEKEKTAP